jgi:hypothetical protein
VPSPSAQANLTSTSFYTFVVTSGYQTMTSPSIQTFFVGPPIVTALNHKQCVIKHDSNSDNTNNNTNSLSSCPVFGGGDLMIFGVGFGSSASDVVIESSPTRVCENGSLVHVSGNEDSQLKCVLKPNPANLTISVQIKSIGGISSVIDAPTLTYSRIPIITSLSHLVCHSIGAGGLSLTDCPVGGGGNLTIVGKGFGPLMSDVVNEISSGIRVCVNGTLSHVPGSEDTQLVCVLNANGPGNQTQFQITSIGGAADLTIAPTVQYETLCYVFNPCANGGTCIGYNFTYTCACALGWAGVNCTSNVLQVNVTVLSPVPLGPCDPLVVAATVALPHTNFNSSWNPASIVFQWRLAQVIVSGMSVDPQGTSSTTGPIGAGWGSLSTRTGINTLTSVVTWNSSSLAINSTYTFVVIAATQQGQTSPPVNITMDTSPLPEIPTLNTTVPQIITRANPLTLPLYASQLTCNNPLIVVSYRVSWSVACVSRFGNGGQVCSSAIAFSNVPDPAGVAVSTLSIPANMLTPGCQYDISATAAALFVSSPNTNFTLLSTVPPPGVRRLLVSSPNAISAFLPFSLQIPFHTIRIQITHSNITLIISPPLVTSKSTQSRTSVGSTSQSGSRSPSDASTTITSTTRAKTHTSDITCTRTKRGTSKCQQRRRGNRTGSWTRTTNTC